MTTKLEKIFDKLNLGLEYSIECDSSSNVNIIEIDRNHLLVDEFLKINEKIKIHSITANDDKVQLLVLKDGGV